jgi:hypothetical protein
LLRRIWEQRPRSVFGAAIAIPMMPPLAGAPYLGGSVAFFVLIVVGVVVAQTWFDWRQTRKDWIIPDWAKGAALGGVIAVSLAAATSFATAWMEDPSAQWAVGFGARAIWSQALFLIVMAAIVITAARKKRMRWTLVVAGTLVAVFWIGITIFS